MSGFNFVKKSSASQSSSPFGSFSIVSSAPATLTGFGTGSSPFGSAPSNPSSSSSSSPFGLSSNTASSPAFGTSNRSSAPFPSFGVGSSTATKTTASASNPSFGSGSLFGSTPSQSPFSSSSSAPTSLFGAPIATPNTRSSPFGSSSASASPLFGSSSKSASSTVSTKTLFGSASSSAASNTPSFPSFLSSSSAAPATSSFPSFSTPAASSTSRAPSFSVPAFGVTPTAPPVFSVTLASSAGLSVFSNASLPASSSQAQPSTALPAFSLTTSATATTTTTGINTSAAQTSTALAVASTTGTTSNVNVSTTISTTTPKLPSEITGKTVEEAPTEAMPLTILASELPPPAFRQPPQAMETSATATDLPFDGIPALTMGEGTGHISEINSTSMARSTSATPLSTEAKSSEPCDIDQSFKGTCNEDLPPELQSATKQDAPVPEVEEKELIASPREETATEASANSPPRAVKVTETNNGAAKSTSDPETLPLEVSTTCVRSETSERDDQAPKDNISQLINKASESDSTFSKTGSAKVLTPESKLSLRNKLKELSLPKNSITQLTEEESKAYQLLREVTDTSFFDQRECQERVEAAVFCLSQRKMTYQWILSSILKALEELPQAFHSYDGLQKELANLTSQGLKIHEQQTQLHAQASEVQQANDSVDQKKARVTTLEEQVKALQAEINTLNAEIAIEEDKATDALVESVTSLEEWNEKVAQHESEASSKQREVLKAELHYKFLCTTIVRHIQNLP